VIKTINQQTPFGREQPVEEAPHSAKKRAYTAELRELAEHVRNRAVLYAFGAASIARPWWIIDVEDPQGSAQHEIGKA
jgi:hypothetical protein